MDYITNELQNPTAAQNLGQKIVEAINTVCSFPCSGLLMENNLVNDDSVRRVVVGKYIVYYKAVEPEKKIYIVRILYGYRKQDIIFS